MSPIQELNESYGQQSQNESDEHPSLYKLCLTQKPLKSVFACLPKTQFAKKKQLLTSLGNLLPDIGKDEQVTSLLTNPFISMEEHGESISVHRLKLVILLATAEEFDLKKQFLWDLVSSDPDLNYQSFQLFQTVRDLAEIGTFLFFQDHPRSLQEIKQIHSMVIEKIFEFETRVSQGEFTENVPSWLLDAKELASMSVSQCDDESVDISSSSELFQFTK
jgi:hypothetical protein